MKGIEVGEILGMFITRIEDFSKKVIVVAASKEDPDNTLESLVTKKVDDYGKQALITSKVDTHITVSAQEFIFELQKHYSKEEVVFGIYTGEKCNVFTTIPKFADISVREYIDYIEINILVNKILI